MAGRTTKNVTPKKEVEEEVISTEVVEEIKSDVLEEAAPETETLDDSAVATEEEAKEEAAPETETLDDASVATDEEAKEEVKEEAVVDSKLQSEIEEFLGAEAQNKLQDLVDNNPDNLEDALKTELNRVSDIAEKVREEIKKTEEVVKKKTKVNYIYQNSLGQFWNGTSNGWNN